MNRTTFEMGRAMLYHARLPSVFWGVAVLCAVYTRNRVLTSSTSTQDRVVPSSTGGPPTREGRTPFELWTGEKPRVGHMRVFGSDAYVHVPRSDRSGKVDVRAHECIMVGYDDDRRRGYCVFDLVTGKLTFSRDVDFNEEVFSFRGRVLTDALAKHGTYVEEEESDESVMENMMFDSDTRSAMNISRDEHAQRQREAAADGAAEEEESKSESHAQERATPSPQSQVSTEVGVSARPIAAPPAVPSIVVPSVNSVAPKASARVAARAA
jgi:hypothetical protein